MNVALLRQIQVAIQAEPGRFSMYSWMSLAPNCSTAYCISGWAVKLSGLDLPVSCGDIPLHLNVDEASRLFHENHWPKQFRGKGNSVTQAVARIDHFILTEGRE